LSYPLDTLFPVDPYKLNCFVITLWYSTLYCAFGSSYVFKGHSMSTVLASPPTIYDFSQICPVNRSFHATNFFENRLKFCKVMDDIRCVGFVTNEAERLRRKSSTNFKTKFLPEYSFNCCKNLKRCCRNYPASTYAEIMQNIHGLTPFWV